eukprot:7385120-Prymnesium_polylepis.2
MLGSLCGWAVVDRCMLRDRAVTRGTEERGEAGRVRIVRHGVPLIPMVHHLAARASSSPRPPRASVFRPRLVLGAC